MANTVQLTQDGNIVYPITDVSCVMGLDEGAITEAVLCWDGASTPVVANIPAGVVVTYNSTTYTGTLAASADTVGKIYMVATGTSNNYNRYMTFAGSPSYVWKNIGDTTIDLSSYATKAEVDELEAKVDDLDGTITELNQDLGIESAPEHSILGVNYATAFTQSMRDLYFFQWLPLDYDVVVTKLYNLHAITSTAEVQYIILDNTKTLVSSGTLTIPANATSVETEILVPAGYYIGFRSRSYWTLFGYDTAQTTPPVTAFHYNNGTVTNVTYNINFSVDFHRYPIYKEKIKDVSLDAVVPDKKSILGSVGGSVVSSSILNGYAFVQWNLLDHDVILTRIYGFETLSADKDVIVYIFPSDFSSAITYPLVLSSGENEVACNILVPKGCWCGVKCPESSARFTNPSNTSPNTNRYNYNLSTGVATALTYALSFCLEYADYDSEYIGSVRNYIEALDESKNNGDVDESLEEILSHNDEIIHLGAKTYVVSSPIVLASGTHIKGVRGKTILKLGGTNETIFSIPANVSNITIEDISFEGRAAISPAYNELTFDQYTNLYNCGNDCAIYGTGHNNYVIISNCVFTNFSKAGIHFNSIFDLTKNPKITDCYFFHNYIGLFLDTRAEFLTISGCTFNSNQLGACVKGGNNYFACCHFDTNGAGFVLLTGDNNSHGSVVGSSFNHSEDFSIVVKSITNGFTFTGCQAWFGDMQIDNSVGFSFVGGIVSCNVVFTNQPNTGFNMIHDCIFRNSDYATVSCATNPEYVSLSGNRRYNSTSYADINNEY